MLTTSDHIIETKTTQLEYLRKGEGFPLVFLHGYLGGAQLWGDQIDAFSERFDVIAPELAGYGSSFDKTACDSISGFSEQVLSLLGQIGVERFHLLGHSMGGMIAQQMAVMAPERIERLICYGTGPLGVLPDRFETLEVSRNRLRTDGVKTTAERIAATWFEDGERATGYPVCLEQCQRVSETTALAGLTAMEAWDGRNALTEIQAPTLVMWGDRDRSYGWAQPCALWQGIAGSNLAVLPGCGHNAHMEKPEIFNALLGGFLQDSE